MSSELVKKLAIEKRNKGFFFNLQYILYVYPVMYYKYMNIFIFPN